MKHTQVWNVNYLIGQLNWFVFLFVVDIQIQKTLRGNLLVKNMIEATSLLGVLRQVVTVRKVLALLAAWPSLCNSIHIQIHTYTMYIYMYILHTYSCIYVYVEIYILYVYLYIYTYTYEHCCWLKCNWERCKIDRCIVWDRILWNVDAKSNWCSVH